MPEMAFSHLRKESNRTKRLRKKHRRFLMRKSLMRNQGVSKEVAKQLSEEQIR